MNWTAIIVALITIVPTTLAVLVTWRSNKKAIKEVHVLINSRMSELLETTKSDSKAKGKSEGKIEERKEVAERLEANNI